MSLGLQPASDISEKSVLTLLEKVECQIAALDHVGILHAALRFLSN